MLKIDRAHKNYRTPEIWEETHLREIFYGTLIFQQSQEPIKSIWSSPDKVASHAGVFTGACISSLPTNACSTEDNIPFPRLANHVVLSKFWKVDLDRKVTR